MLALRRSLTDSLGRVLALGGEHTEAWLDVDLEIDLDRMIRSARVIAIDVFDQTHLVMRDQRHEGGEFSRCARQWPIVSLSLAAEILNEGIGLIQYFKGERFAKAIFVPAFTSQHCPSRSSIP